MVWVGPKVNTRIPSLPLIEIGLDRLKPVIDRIVQPSNEIASPSAFAKTVNPPPE
jgi:hypothetical protein